MKAQTLGAFNKTSQADSWVGHGCCAVDLLLLLIKKKKLLLQVVSANPDVDTINFS